MRRSSDKISVIESGNPLSEILDQPLRPTGTTASEGYKVCRKCGRSTGTTVSDGYKTGQSGGRLGKNITILGDLPSEWDTSAVNLTNDLLSKCQSRLK